MKLERHAAILRLVREHRLPNQEALKRALEGLGIEVAQATLSRDIRDLGLIKQADPDGGAFYAMGSAPATHPDMAQLLRAMVVGLDGVGGLLVLRTKPGGAEAVATAVGQAGWPEVLGITTGPDTVLIVTRGEPGRQAVGRRLEGMTRQTGGRADRRADGQPGR